MLRVRYLLYIGLTIYLLDLYALRADALELPKLFGKEEKEDKKEKDQSKESSKQAFYRMAYHRKSRETNSGEHLQYPYNPYCGWTKLFGGAGLQANCFLNGIVGTYKVIRKYVLAIDAVL